MDITTLTEEELRATITAWREAREARLELDKQAREAKKIEDSHKALLIEAYRAKSLEGQVIGGRVTGLTTRTVPTVADKEAFMAYIRQTGELDLLEFRPHAGAIKARWDEEVDVPGCQEVEVYDLFDRKI